MNINPVNNRNNVSFNAGIKIVKTSTFKKPDKYFNEAMKQLEGKWANRAFCIGSPKDTIKISLGKNDIKTRLFEKQNLSLSADIDGFEIKRNKLDFPYTKFSDGGVSMYYDNLDNIVTDFIEFIRQLSFYKISKK